MPLEELRSSFLNSQIRPDGCWGPRQHNRALQSVTEHLTCRHLEVNNLVLPLQQFLLESIRGCEVILQKVRVLVRRRPCTTCASSQSHACESPFSRHPVLHTMARISAIRDCFAKLPRCTRCLMPGPTTPLLRRRASQTSYGIPTRSAAIPVCLQRSLKVCRTAWDPLSSTDCQRAQLTGLLSSPISLITHSAILGS